MYPNQMTPEQAIDILEQVSALAPVNRSDHYSTLTAIQTIRTFIGSTSPSEPEVPKPQTVSQPAKKTKR